jgi:putative ABC transport system permease protein
MWMSESVTAARALARKPGFSSVVVLTLALGIGANVAIFTVVNAVLLKPLAFPDSNDVVVLNHHAPGLDLPELFNSPAMLNLYLERARSLSALSVMNPRRVNLTGGDRPEKVAVRVVSPSFFDVVATRPSLGRSFTDEDVVPDAEAPQRVAVLMHRAWVERFGEDPGVLGRTVQVDGNAVEIVGVMPRGYTFAENDAVLLLPTYLDPNGQFGTFGVRAIGRLAPGVDLEAARREFTALQAQIPDAIPDVTPQFLDQAGWSVSLERVRDTLVRDVRTALWIVLGTVGFVLLIACANVANLFLVRAEVRQHEVAVRSALGAGRRELAITFLSESVLLGLVAGVAGVVLAWWGVRALVAFGPERLPRVHEIGIDGTVLLVAAAISVAAGVAFGILPVLRYMGSSFRGVLRDGGRGATGGRSRHRARNLLVASQLSLAVVLLVGSGLMLRSFQRLRAVDPGLDPAGVLTVELSLGSGTPWEDALSFYEEALARVRALPGVRAAGATSSLPLSGTNGNGGSFHIESRPEAEDELPPVARWILVTEGHFESLEIPLVEGRPMTGGDHRTEAPVVWVNETFARTFLDGGALRERISIGDSEIQREVAGVVGDVRHLGLGEAVQPTIYLPLVREEYREMSAMTLVVDVAAGEPSALVAGIRDVVGRIDADVPLTTARTMDDVMARSLAQMSFTLTLLGIAAAVALLLGAVGIYGVIAYVVSQRTREIGVRMALGAEAGEVARMVVRQGMAVAVVGVVAGLVGALALAGLMDSLLFEVSARDPLTFGSVPVALLVVAGLASWLPARRAARVDPVRALTAD